MTTVIKAEHLFKIFSGHHKDARRITALDDLSLEVYEGEILGILGPNGAGKTTFLNVLSTLLLPDSGRVEILGIPSVPRNFNRLRGLLNMSSGYPNFPWCLTIEENLQFYGRLYGLSGRPLRKRLDDLIEMFSLGDYAKRRFDELSSGTKQRLSLAKALLNSPRLIFFDEPTIGLDPDVAAKTRKIIVDIIRSAKVTVLLTTHNMQEAEMMCRRVAFIKQGKVLHLAPVEELKRVTGKKDLEEVFIALAKGGLPLHPGPMGPSGRSIALAHPMEPAVFSSSLNSWFNRCFAFTQRNAIFAVRNFFAFAELLFWPIVSVISIGLMGDFLELQEKAMDFVLTGAIAAGVLQVTQLDVAYSLLYEVWSKSMKHTALTPVGISENLFGSWVTGIARGLVVFGVLSLAAVLMFDFRFPPVVVTGIFLWGIFACALLLGLLVSVLLLIYGQKAEITAWMFAYLFMLLCGIYYPVTTLSPFFRAMAEGIPITYFLEYFRQSFGFDSGMSHLLFKGFGLVVFYLAVGLGVMRYAFYQARRKGTIVKLSE